MHQLRQAMLVLQDALQAQLQISAEATAATMHEPWSLRLRNLNMPTYDDCVKFFGL